MYFLVPAVTGTTLFLIKEPNIVCEWCYDPVSLAVQIFLSTWWPSLTFSSDIFIQYTLSFNIIPLFTWLSASQINPCRLTAVTNRLFVLPVLWCFSSITSYCFWCFLFIFSCTTPKSRAIILFTVLAMDTVYECRQNTEHISSTVPRATSPSVSKRPVILLTECLPVKVAGHVNK